MIAKRSTKHNGRHASEPSFGGRPDALAKHKDSRRLWMGLGACAAVTLGLLAGAKATGEFDNIPVGHEVGASQDQEPQPLSIGLSWMDNMRQDITTTSEEWLANYLQRRAEYMEQEPEPLDVSGYQHGDLIGAIIIERQARTDADYAGLAATINDSYNDYYQSIGQQRPAGETKTVHRLYASSSPGSSKDLLGEGVIAYTTIDPSQQLLALAQHTISGVDGPITVDNVTYNDKYAGVVGVTTAGDTITIVRNSDFPGVVEVFTYTVVDNAIVPATQEEWRNFVMSDNPQIPTGKLSGCFPVSGNSHRQIAGFVEQDRGREPGSVSVPPNAA